MLGLYWSPARGPSEGLGTRVLETDRRSSQFRHRVSLLAFQIKTHTASPSGRVCGSAHRPRGVLRNTCDGDAHMFGSEAVNRTSASVRLRAPDASQRAVRPELSRSQSGLSQVGLEWFCCHFWGKHLTLSRERSFTVMQP